VHRRCKPDWHAAEVVSPRETDYYRSDKALGDLYRAIELSEPQPISSDVGVASDAGVVSNVASNPISFALAPRLERALPEFVPPDGSCLEAAAMFRKYAHELRYISVTHTLTTEPGVNLLEAELICGTILAKCNQKRWVSRLPLFLIDI
jgi:RNA-dependent RNA polymerase